MIQFIPKEFTFAQAAPGANTDIFAAEITPTNLHGVFRVAVSLATSSVFNMIVTQGATLKTLSFNGGAAIPALGMFEFDVPVYQYEGTTALTYNFQVATDGVINWLSVREMNGEV